MLSASVALLRGHHTETADRSAVAQVGDTSAADGLSVSAWLIAVDQQRQQATIRLNFVPRGTLTTPDGTLAAPLRLTINGSVAGQDRSYEAGKPMNATDITIGLYDGSVMEYPFDRFTSSLTIGAAVFAFAPSTPTDHVAAEDPMAATDYVDAEETTDLAEDGERGSSTDWKATAVTIDFSGALHGLKVRTAPLAADRAGTTGVSLAISRSPTTLALAWFTMILLLAIAAAVVALTIRITTSGRSPESAVIVLLGVLLFGFAALRNSMPGAPAFGATIDYIAFFLAEGAVAGCLLALVIAHFRRPAVSAKPT